MSNEKLIARSSGLKQPGVDWLYRGLVPVISVLIGAGAHSWSYRSDNPICTRTDVYDKIVLFGDNEWMPASAQKAGSAQTIQVSSEVGYHPTVWDSPADLAAYDAALQSSTQQIENSFGVVVADEQAEQK